MAKLFLSFQRDDKRLARDLQLRLPNHSFAYQASEMLGGDWRAKMNKALADADAVIFLLSERGLQSKYVVSQIGAARVYATVKRQLMLPVIVGGVEVPEIIRDITRFELASDRGESVDQIAKELNQTLVDHAQEVPAAPRIFISHRYKDPPLAAALVALIEAAFIVDKSDIRCTSVPGYALQPGDRVSERLRGDINGAELVIGLIGPETADSRYVLFELGASWGRDVPTFPILVRGATRDDVPGPLSERLALSLEDEARCFDLIDDIEARTSLKRRGNEAKVAQEVRRLAQLASKPERKVRAQPNTKRAKPEAAPARPDSNMERMAQHISNYLVAKNFKTMSFERVRANINAAYSDTAMLEMIDKSPNKFRRAKLKGGQPGIALVP